MQCDSTLNVSELDASIANDGSNFDFAAESFYITTQCRDAMVSATFETRHFGLRHIGGVSELGLRNLETLAKLFQCVLTDLIAHTVMHSRHGFLRELLCFD